METLYSIQSSMHFMALNSKTIHFHHVILPLDHCQFTEVHSSMTFSSEFVLILSFHLRLGLSTGNCVRFPYQNYSCIFM